MSSLSSCPFLQENDSVTLTTRKNGKKKLKRKGKRQRNRFRNYSPSISEGMTFRSSIIPNSSWFWRNYQNAMEWKGRHQMAYWRSRSYALEQENKYLYQYIDDLQVSGFSNKANDKTFQTTIHNSGITPENGTAVPESLTSAKSDSSFCGDPVDSSHDTYSQNNRKGRRAKKKQHVNSSNKRVISKVPNHKQQVVSENDSESFEFEVNDEMLDFLETSMKHKIELKKLRETGNKQSDAIASKDGEQDEDLTLPPKKQVGLQRIEEMKSLYGESAPMIMGMETAIQLAFDRNCDKSQPPLWPVIPLNL